VKAFVCFADHSEVVAPAFQGRLETQLAALGARPLWHLYPNLSIATLGGDLPGGPSVQRVGNLIGVGMVRLDNRSSIQEKLKQGVRSANDCELVLRVVQQFGSSVIPELIGDFGIVVWDTITKECIAARDALGVRTLYRTTDHNVLALSSRCDLLAPDGLLNDEYIAEFLVCNTPTSDHTVFRGVRAVPAGGQIRWQSGRIVESHYWRPEVSPPDILKCDQAPVMKFRQLLREAIRLRVPDDQGVWAQLSGGLDSSTLVLLIDSLARSKERRRSLAGTVTIVDRLGSGDESEFTRAVINSTGLPNEVLDNGWMWQEDGSPPPMTDTPHAFYPFYARDRLLCRIVRDRGGTSLLSGIGPDHYLTGDLTYLADLAARGEWWHSVRDAHHWAVAKRRSMLRYIRNYIVYPQLPLAVQRYLAMRQWRIPKYIEPRLVERFGLAARQDEIRLLEAQRGDLAASRRRFLVRRLATGAVQQQQAVDSALDIRFPFLYRPLVEFALSLPSELLIRPPSMQKWIMREAMNDILPERIRLRSGKGTIGARIRWSIVHERERVMDLARESILGELGCVRPAVLTRAIKYAISNGVLNSRRLQRVLALETWLRVRAGRWSGRESRPYRSSAVRVPLRDNP